MKRSKIWNRGHQYNLMFDLKASARRPASNGDPYKIARHQSNTI